MAKLKRLQPRLGTMPQRLALPQGEIERSRHRDRSEPWRAWYKTARWQKRRWGCLVAAGFTCVDCGTLFADTSQLVADHVEDHKGDPVAFWEGRLACRCVHCHGRKARTPAGSW